MSTAQVQPAAPASPWGQPVNGRLSPSAIREKRWRRFARWTLITSVVHLVLSAGLIFLMLDVSENWWLSGTLLFVPQLALLIPAVCLCACSIVFHFRSLALNLTSLGMLAVCVCGFRFSMKPLSEQPPSDGTVRVLTCNVQNFQPSFTRVLREIARNRPDIVALQEARDTPPQMLTDYLEGWSFQHVDQYWVGSRWPVRLIGMLESSPYERTTAMKVQIDAPTGPIVLSNIHLTTARRGLSELSVGSIVTGDGPAAVESHAFLRYEEAAQARDFVNRVDDDKPHLIVGDFNMPTTSSTFDDHFGDLTNAFDESGIGFGFTAPCRPVRFWIPNTPWLRIDHVLTSSHWEAMACEVGEFNGSDHRLVVATLQPANPNQAPP